MSDRDALQAPLRVFIAEDDKGAAVALGDLLVAQGGIEVVGTADSEGAAAEWLVNHAADLVITDLLLLPGGSGFGVVQHAKTLGFRCVVVFSSFATQAVAEKCKKLGADAVFRKTELDDLLDYVRARRFT